MAWPQYRGRLVPWVSWGEWDSVREGLFAAEPEAQQRALGVVSQWRIRGFVPHAVESTAQLVEVLLAQAYGGRSGRETQLALSASLVRFVNGVVEPGQKSVRAISVTRLAHFAQLPQWLVELRHGATHSSLPTLPGLQAAAPQALHWLRESYWQRQRDFVINSIGACASALEDAGRFAAAAARLSRRSTPLSLTSDFVLSASAPHIVISAADKASRARARQGGKRRRDAKAAASESESASAPAPGQVVEPVSEEEAASRAAVAAGRAQDALSPHGTQDVLVPLLLCPAALFAQYGSLVPPEVLRAADVSHRCGAASPVPVPAGASVGTGCFLRGWWVPVASRSLPPTRQGFERLLARWLPALLAWDTAGGPRSDVPLLALCAAARAVGYEQRAAVEARGVDDAGARLLSHRLFFLVWWVRFLLSAHWHTMAAIARRTRTAVSEDSSRKRPAPGRKAGSGGGGKAKGEAGGDEGAVALPTRAYLDRPGDAASIAPCTCSPPSLPPRLTPARVHLQTSASSPRRCSRCARGAAAHGQRPCSPWWTRAAREGMEVVAGTTRSRASRPRLPRQKPSPTRPATCCLCPTHPRRLRPGRARRRVGSLPSPRRGSARTGRPPTVGGRRAPPSRDAALLGPTEAAGPSTRTSCRGRGRARPRDSQRLPEMASPVLGTKAMRGQGSAPTRGLPRRGGWTRRARARESPLPPRQHPHRHRIQRLRGRRGREKGPSLAGAGLGALQPWICCRSTCCPRPTALSPSVDIYTCRPDPCALPTRCPVGWGPATSLGRPAGRGTAAAGSW